MDWLAKDDRESTRWWVVHTRANHEKTLSKRLAAMGVQHFLPLVSVRRERQGRIWCIERPLFSSYLFLLGKEEDRYAALTTDCVAATLHVTDQAGLDRSLRDINRVLLNGEPIDACPGLKTGRRCRVRVGPLKGLEGTVLRRSKVTRVYIAVQILGQSAEVEIDSDWLDVVD
jgi:transcription antitermination factor NusG